MLKLKSLQSWYPGSSTLSSFKTTAPLKRHISYQQATSTLRPFFFAVHPDFFTQHPKFRSQNEQSLKLLNAHLITLGERRQSSFTNEKNLLFYIRSGSSPPRGTLLSDNQELNVRQVKISLQHRNLKDLVRHVLQSSDFPLTEFLTQVKKSDAREEEKTKSKVKIKFYGQYWADHDGPDWQDINYERPRSTRETASSWFIKNIPSAKESFYAQQPIINDVSAMESSLTKTYGLLEVIWRSGMTTLAYLSCLRRLEKVLQEAHLSSDLSYIKGKRIIFTEQTGVSVFDDLLLGARDVPQAWFYTIRHSTPSQTVLPKGPQLSSLEKGVSLLLYGARVIRHPDIHETTLKRNYYHQVFRLFCSLSNSTKKESPQFPKQLFSDLSVSIEDITGSITYDDDLDLYLVPGDTPAFLLIDYLWQHYSSKDESRQKYVKERTRFSELCDELVKDWQLVGVHLDNNVSLKQGLRCLEALSTRRFAVLPYVGALSGLELCISHKFAISNSGLICVPWNVDWT